MTCEHHAIMSTWGFLADVVAVFHAGYVLFVVGGALAILLGWVFRWNWVRNPWFRLIHLLAILVVAAEAISGISCPLTDLERVLRVQGGLDMYREDFLVYWAHRLLYLDNVPQWVFDVGHVVFGLVVLSLLFIVPPHWPRRTSTVRTGKEPADQSESPPV